MQKRLCTFGYVVAFVFSIAVNLLVETAPTAQETWKIEDLSADLIGVASDGHLWTWVRAEGRVRVFEPDGAEVLDLRIGSGASAVDVEPSWGVAILDDLGLQLEVRRPDGSTLPPVALPHAASSVAWIDKNAVALAPDRAAYRVEVWDVANARQIQRMGQETVIGNQPGAAFLRRVELAYDPHRTRLFTLESRTGEFVLFDLEGNELGSGEVTNPRLEEFEAWLAELDRRAREQNDVQRPSLSLFHLTLTRLRLRPTSGVSARGCFEE